MRQGCNATPSQQEFGEHLEAGAAGARHDDRVTPVGLAALQRMHSHLFGQLGELDDLVWVVAAEVGSEMHSQ